MEKVVPNSQICRCCVRTNINLSSMKGLEFRYNGKKVILVEGFFECSGIDPMNYIPIIDDDPKICDSCKLRLQNAYSFRVMCSKANRKLRQLYLSPQELKYEEDDEDFISAAIDSKPPSVKQSPTQMDVKSESSSSSNASSSDDSVDSEDGEADNNSVDKPSMDEDIFADNLGDGKKQDHICKICGKKFIFKSRLKVHMDGHNQIRKYQCSKCGKSFLRTSHFNEHLDTHLDYKKFPCPLCPATYRQRTGLKYHMKNHHKESDETKNEFWTKPDSNRKKNKHRLLLRASNNTTDMDESQTIEELEPSEDAELDHGEDVELEPSGCDVIGLEITLDCVETTDQRSQVLAIAEDIEQM